MIYVHYFQDSEKCTSMQNTLFDLVKQSREVSLVAPEFPLLSGVTVLNNITLQARYLYSSSPKKVKVDTINLLNNFSMLYILNKYPDTLNSYERFVASYLQAIYIHPNTTIIIKPAQMLNWQQQQLEKFFSHMPNILNTIIIEDIANKKLYDNITINKEVDFYQWLDSLKNLLSIA